MQCSALLLFIANYRFGQKNLCQFWHSEVLELGKNYKSDERIIDLFKMSVVVIHLFSNSCSYFQNVKLFTYDIEPRLSKEMLCSLTIYVTSDKSKQLFY